RDEKEMKPKEEKEAKPKGEKEAKPKEEKGEEEERLGFAGASQIVDSPELLKLINASAKEQIDAKAFLKARLTDFLINDNDRHAGQWKWAEFPGKKHEWEPIARDRDHAFVSYEGFVSGVAQRVKPGTIPFTGRPIVAGLVAQNEMDVRILSGLERPVWDSVARDVQRRVTDSVIHVAVMSMPVEYRSVAQHMEAVLKERRAALPAAAEQYYRMLAARVQVHGTD